MPPDHALCTSVLPPPALVGIGRPCLSEPRLQNHCGVIVTISHFWLGEVNIEVPDQDQFHAVWSVAERHGDMIGIGSTYRWDESPDNETLTPPCHHMEAEAMRSEVLICFDMLVVGSVEEERHPPLMIA